MEKMDVELKKCMTPEFRVSFPAILEPKSFKGNEPKYSLAMIFPKGTDIKELKRAAFNAAVESWGPKDKWPKNLRWPWRDGDVDREGTPGYENSVFVAATSKQRPGLIDRHKKPILTEEIFYAGCYARASLIAFSYDNTGNRGVSFALQNVQKLKDGEKFGGRRNAEDDFKDDLEELPADDIDTEF